MNSVTRKKKILTLDWNRKLSYVSTAERNKKSIWTTRSLFSAAIVFHQVEVHHSHRPKNRNNSLIQDQKSNKYIANGYKNQVRAFKREAVQFLMAKNIAVNHLLLEALWTKRHSRGGRVVTFALSQTDTVRGAGAFNSAGNSSRVYDTWNPKTSQTVFIIFHSSE